MKQMILIFAVTFSAGMASKAIAQQLKLQEDAMAHAAGPGDPAIEADKATGFHKSYTPSVWPSDCAWFFHFRLPLAEGEDQAELTFQISDEQGIVLMEGHSEPWELIDVSVLPEGKYIVSVYFEGQIIAEDLMISR